VGGGGGDKVGAGKVVGGEGGEGDGAGGGVRKIMSGKEGGIRGGRGGAGAGAGGRCEGGWGGVGD